MSLTVTSTTDSAETVNAVMGKTAESEAGKEGATSAPGAEKSLEQKESTDSEPAEKEETESGKDESEESDSDEELEAKDDASEKPKKKGGFQRRIDKLNARNAQAQAELEYWRQQALKGAGAPKDEKKPEASSAQATEGKPNVNDFESHGDYIEALTEWKTEQKLKEHAQKQERTKLESEQQRQLRTHSERVRTFAEKTEDFQDVLEAVDDIPVSAALREIVVSSDNGPELMYELAKNRDEYARICKLAPLAAAREIGKIESRLAANASSEKKPEPKKITSASKPLAPVNASKGSAEKDPETMDYQQYKRWREAQLKKR